MDLYFISNHKSLMMNINHISYREGVKKTAFLSHLQVHDIWSYKRYNLVVHKVLISVPGNISIPITLSFTQTYSFW